MMLCFVDRTYLMLLYRTDVFDALGLLPPETWEEMADLVAHASLWQQAAALVTTATGTQGNVTEGGAGGSTTAESSAPTSSNTTSNGTASPAPMYPLCLALAPNCTGLYLLNAIFASITSVYGPSQVSLSDPGAHA
jgi:hypothetical protein